MGEFSVVIPTYNRAHLLPRTLLSVLNQKDSAMDIIVVDDGSTDQTEAVVKGFGSSVRFFRQEQAGPGAARNLGRREARGEYIAFLDSDDLWLPWTLETYRTALRNRQEPRFILGNPFWFREESELDGANRADLAVENYRDYLASAKRSIWLGASSMLIRGDCQIEFASEKFNGEDLDFALHCGGEIGFVWIKHPFTFAYRQHSGSAVQNLSRSIDGMAHMLEEERANRYPGGTQRRRERAELITRAVRPVTLAAWRHHDFATGWRFYRQTARWHLELGRWKFLLAAPMIGLWQRSRPRKPAPAAGD